MAASCRINVRRDGFDRLGGQAVRADLIADVLLILALLLVVVGVALIYVPAALIVAGCGVAALAIWMGRNA